VDKFRLKTVTKTLPKGTLYGCHLYGQVLRFGYWKTNGFPRMGFKMLNCQICAARVDVLAHQVRGSIEVTVCLDCADRYYQDQLTKSLINAEKVGA
jgi:hypothetical protein